MVSLIKTARTKRGENGLESRWSKKRDEIVFIWPIDHPHDPAGHTTYLLGRCIMYATNCQSFHSMQFHFRFHARSSCFVNGSSADAATHALYDLYVPLNRTYLDANTESRRRGNSRAQGDSPPPPSSPQPSSRVSLIRLA